MSDASTLALVAAVLRGCDSIVCAIYNVDPERNRDRDAWEPMTHEEAVANAEDLLERAKAYAEEGT
jgi:hypothetical protein